MHLPATEFVASLAWFAESALLRLAAATTAGPLQPTSTGRWMSLAEFAIRPCDSLFLFHDDATFVVACFRHWREAWQTLLSINESQYFEGMMAGKTLEEHFREQGELIDRRFAEVDARFTAQDRRFDAIDARFGAIEARFNAIDARFISIDRQFAAVHKRFEAMDERFNRVVHELSLIRRDVGLVLAKLNAA